MASGNRLIDRVLADRLVAESMALSAEYGGALTLSYSAAVEQMQRNALNATIRAAAPPEPEAMEPAEPQEDDLSGDDAKMIGDDRGIVLAATGAFDVRSGFDMRQVGRVRASRLGSCCLCGQATCFPYTPLALKDEEAVTCPRCFELTVAPSSWWIRWIRWLLR
jgi:hypothetical protein